MEAPTLMEGGWMASTRSPAGSVCLGCTTHSSAYPLELICSGTSTAFLNCSHEQLGRPHSSSRLSGSPLYRTWRWRGGDGKRG